MRQGLFVAGSLLALAWSTAAVAQSVTSDAAKPSANAAQAAPPEAPAVPPPAEVAPSQAATGSEATGNKDVVVTATRSAKAIDKIPGAISVLSQKEVSQQFQVADDPAAALAALVPGFSPSRQKLSSSGESIRGRTALILLDGIPQGNPLRDGRREGYFLDSALIQRVEIVSGASAIYGLGATGGIVNYITKTAPQGTHQQVDVRLATGFQGSDNLDWKAGYLFTHKSDLLDVVAYAGYDKRGMLFDARHRLLGLVPSVGDTMDSHSTNLFLKVGKDFDGQRIEVAVNRFRLFGEGDFVPVNGDPLRFVTTTATRGRYPAGVVPFNRILSGDLTYSNTHFLGGSLAVQLFLHASDVLFGPDTAAAFQDPRLTPIGTLYDQGLLFDRKKGGKLTYVHPNLVIPGLELTLGVDQIFDTTHQDMILTNRVWLTPLKYKSTAPFGQLEFDRGPITVRGGLRYESGSLVVDNYTTLGYYGRTTNGYNGVPVQGGRRTFSRLVKNLGAVARLGGGWSAFAAYSEGFGLPDVGILLRSVTALNQSVDRLVSLEPVVTSSKEIGLNLRKPWGSFGVSAYESYSALGSTLRVGSDGLGQVVRVPTRVRGIEATAEAHPVAPLGLFATYTLTDGKTAEDVGKPIDLDLGGRSQGPDKVTAAIDYAFRPGLSARLQAIRFFDRDVNAGRGTLSGGFYSLEEHFRGYTTVDFTASIPTPIGTIGLSAENLLNQYYVTYFSQVTRTSASDANKQYVAGRGRSYAISLTTRF